VAEYLSVLTTTDTADKAEALARGAVEARVAACAQVEGPVTSVYWWGGVVRSEEEWRVVYKTTGERYAELEAYIEGAHDYETPEVIATPVARGSAGYLAWVDAETATR
jgi:periplasmic divalent cation tolerance protein